MRSTKTELLAALEKIKGTPILVVGDIILDRYIWGQVERISPEAPVPVVKTGRVEDRLGGAANVVRNLAKIGAKVSVCGFVGDDREGQIVQEQLTSLGVERDGVMIDAARPTTVKTRVIAQNQQIVRIDREESVFPKLALREGFAAAVDAHLNNAKGVIISDYGKGAVTETLMKKFSEARKAKRSGLGVRPVVVDPKPVNYEIYGGITCATPNRAEAEAAAGMKIVDKLTALEAAKKLIDRWEAEMMIITLGAAGMLIVSSRDDQGTFLETVARQVFDVSGAGDTVIAVLTLALAAGIAPVLAGELANIAAGIVVSQVGTVAVELAQFQAEVERLGADARTAV